MSALSVLSFGEVLWDIIEGEEYLGGAPFNLAAHLSRMGCASAMITGVGDDDRGRRVLDEMDKLGVDKRLVVTDSKHPTGTVKVDVDADGQPTYDIHRDSAWDFIELTGEQIDELARERFDVLCFGTLSQRSETSRAALLTVIDAVEVANVFFDINLRQDYWTKEIIQSSLAVSTIVKLNHEEASVIGDLLYGREFAGDELEERLVREFDLEIICITCGDKGCNVFHQGERFHHDGLAVDVVDTVGAGDAFSAAFLRKYCTGSDSRDSAMFANRVAAFVASRQGAIPGDMPDNIASLL